MKAIRVHEAGGPEVMHLEEVPDPEPRAGEVVVELKAVGVNPVDTYIRAATVYKPTYPYTPGSDGAGIVAKVGQGVTRVSQGQRVYVAGSLSGTYAQRALCKETQVHRLGELVSFAQGAGVNVPYATAYRALFQRANSKPGEVVLVHGATGGVGIAAVQLARAAGMTVVGTGGSEKGRALVLEQGAQLVLDHHREGYLDQLRDFTSGRGADVILEMLANVNLGKDFTVLARNGRVVVIGSRGTVEVNPRDLMGCDGVVLGMTLNKTPEEEIFPIHYALVEGLANGVLRPIVGMELALSEAAKAHEEVLKSAHYGKIVLIPS